jgi:antitoxin VapB
MVSAKIFRHGGSQAVRLPKAFRFASTEVIVEKLGDDVVLKPMPGKKFRSFTEIARHLAATFPAAEDFPAPPPRPAKHERPAPTF